MKNTLNEYSAIPSASRSKWDENIVVKVMKTLRDGETHYVDVPGNPELRANIGAYLISSGIAKGGQVLVTAGVQEARFLTIQVLGKALGTIAFPGVMHPGIKEVLTVRDLVHVSMDMGTDRRMLAPIEAIKNTLSEGAKVLYIESPSRLTGAFYEKTELSDILSLCEKHGASLIMDSGLRPWIEGPAEASAWNLMIDDSVSIIGETWPGRGIDDMNIGYILTSEDIVKKIAKQKQVLSICTSAPSQNGAIAAGKDYLQNQPEIIAALKEKQTTLESSLQDMGAKILSGPVVSFVVFETDPVVQKKLDAAKIGYWESAHFGKPGYIHLPVSTEAIDSLH